MTDSTPWLTDDEQHLWRSWLTVNRRVSALLARDMQGDGRLSMADFEVLVNLTDSPHGRLRVSDLATNVQWERSRLSHQVSRMVGRGLVEKSTCSDDGRGAWVGVTDAGRAAIEQAAPKHVRAVRRHFFDVLTQQDIAALTQTTDRLLENLPTDQ